MQAHSDPNESVFENNQTGKRSNVEITESEMLSVRKWDS